MKTTPKEKMIIGLMEEVINILSTCKLGDPEFDMYDVMKDAVEKEDQNTSRATQNLKDEPKLVLLGNLIKMRPCIC